MFTIIIPAHNEETLIGTCLDALVASDPISGVVEVIVAANGCTDKTADVARGYADALRAKGWGLRVLDLPEGGKLAALNAADRSAQGTTRAYLDADVTVSPSLMAGIERVLRSDDAAYASGQVNVVAGEGAASRAYARLWAQVPFMTTDVPGCGLFAVNASGRARWGDWPDIIGDDAFARLKFTPDERHLVPAPYDWPIASGFNTLVKVRRRQNTGVAELSEKFPELLKNDGVPGLGAGGYARLALRDPIGFATYCAVAVMVKIKGEDRTWSRSR